MVTPRKYLETIVEPTFAEYLENQGSFRKAFLSAVTLLHLCDVIAHNRVNADVGKVVEEFCNDCASFRVVELVALLGKHISLKKRKFAGASISDVREGLFPNGVWDDEAYWNDDAVWNDEGVLLEVSDQAEWKSIPAALSIALEYGREAVRAADRASLRLG